MIKAINSILITSCPAPLSHSGRALLSSFRKPIFLPEALAVRGVSAVLKFAS